MKRTGDIVDRYMQAWNDRDAEQVRACFTAEGCYIDSVHEREIVGDEIIAYCENSFENHPDMEYEIINRTATTAGNMAVQWIMTGTGIEAILDLPPCGKRVSCIGVDFILLQDGLIRTCTSYYDTASLARGVDRGRMSGSAPAEFEKYQRTRLSDETVDRIKVELQRLVGEQRIFSDPDMSLVKLGGLIDLSPTYLSQVINREFQLNFRDFLNSVRVENARKQLEDPAKSSIPVVQIGFDVGFNSASVYYAAFRKFTGTTPLNYRKRRL